jgi:TfoX/Sxy family transcriptional regulator of competence genes
MSVDTLAGRIRHQLEGRKTTEQKMFGGICFMIGGNMAVCASRDGLLARVGKDGMAAALKKAGARPMQMGGRTMSGYVYVDETAIRTDRALSGWIGRALAFVATLPAKQARKPLKSRPTTQRKRAT